MNAPARNDDARRQPGVEADQKQLNRNDTSTENQRQIILQPASDLFGEVMSTPI